MVVKTKVAFLGSWGAHRAAISCAKEITTEKHFYFVSYFKIFDFKPFKRFSTLKVLSTFIKAFYHCFKIPKYDIYFLNSPTALFLGFLKKVLRREKCLLIIRVNNSIFSEKNFLKRYFLRILISKLDGAIAVSEMIRNDIKKNSPELPVRIFYSPLRSDDFFKVKPDFDSKNIVCVGINSRLGKGTDIQVDVFKILKNFRKNIEMFILGSYEKAKDVFEKNKKLKGLYFTGIVDPKIYFKKSLFLLHPARFDASPNAVFEAMASGMIPIISHRTGRTEMVKEVDPTLIISNFNSRNYVKKIKYLLRLSDKELMNLSKKCREVAYRHNETAKIRGFRNVFWDLINEIRK